MTPRTEIADIVWLTGSAAGAILAELAEDAAPLHSVAARLRKSLSPSQTHLLLEQTELRRRAAAKFTHPQQMFFTRVGLEQSTDEWVAKYKSQRFLAKRGESDHVARGAPVRGIADLCCGIGGELMALANCASAVGVDRDPVVAHFAAINTGVAVRTIDVTDFDFDGVDAWHIDPDRRPTGRRTTSLERCQPDVAAIEQLLARVPNAAVKLAPATKPPAEWIDRCESEWISRDGECKQLVAWHGNLASSRGERRATVLTSKDVSSVRAVVGQPNHPIPIVSRPDRYVFDVDPAIVAARLTGSIAAALGLSALGSGPTYLTAGQAIADAALGCFEVIDILPFRIRTLSQHLHARGIGSLEIKKRGVELDPEKLRRDLKLCGSNAATLLITRIAGQPIAIVANRVSTL